MNNKKQKLTTFQRWVVIIGMVGLIITSAGFLIRHQLLDPDGGNEPIYIPTNGDDPVFYPPVISLDSITITDLDEDSFTFRLFVTNRPSVSNMEIVFYVDGTLSFRTPLLYVGSGYYEKTFTISQFSGADSDSEITIDLQMTYFHDILGYSITDTEEDVVDGFSFVYIPEDPEYTAPEIIDGTFAKSIIEPLITFSFATENYEHINSISYHFVVDNEVVKDSNDQDVVKSMTVDENGVFSTLFDYIQLGVDLEETTWIYLTMNFINEDSENEDRVYEDFSSFEYGTEPTPTTTPTNGSSINYIFIIIATMAAFTLFAAIKKIKRRQINNAKIY